MDRKEVVEKVKARFGIADESIEQDPKLGDIIHLEAGKVEKVLEFLGTVEAEGLAVVDLRPKTQAVLITADTPELSRVGVPDGKQVKKATESFVNAILDTKTQDQLKGVLENATATTFKGKAVIESVRAGKKRMAPAQKMALRRQLSGRGR